MWCLQVPSSNELLLIQLNSPAILFLNCKKFLRLSVIVLVVFAPVKLFAMNPMIRLIAWLPNWFPVIQSVFHCMFFITCTFKCCKSSVKTKLTYLSYSLPQSLIKRRNIALDLHVLVCFPFWPNWYWHCEQDDRRRIWYTFCVHYDVLSLLWVKSIVFYAFSLLVFFSP